MVCCLNPSCPNPLNPDGTELCHSCGTRLVPSLRNRYRVIRPLGGGFSKTFLAQDEDNSNLPCVVKQLVPQLQDSNTLQRAKALFQQEAQRLQQLSEHPQIPILFAYFEQDNYLYLVQQLIIGQTLRQELEQEGAFSEQKIWDLLSTLLPLLYFVHKQQLIHRDIKPENIIRRQSDGKLVLIDFGIAMYLSAAGIPLLGTTFGSFGYAPIKQMNNGETDSASDLFSLGVTCLHLLTQIHPSLLCLEHGYDWANNWRQYLKKSPVSQELSQVLDKLLRIDTQQRYQFVDVNPGKASPVPLLSPDNSVPDAFEGDRESLSLSVLPAPAVQRNFNKRLLLGSAILLLLGLAGFMYWQQNLGGLIATLTGHTDEVNTVAFSPDGQKMATASDDRTIKVWSVKSTKELRTLIGHLDWVYSVAISPDNQTLVSGSKDNTIKVWDINTGAEIRSIEGYKSYVNSVAVSSDGQTVVSGSYDKTIHVLNLKTGQEKVLRGHSGEVLAVAISPNSQQIVSGSADTTLKLWNLKTGKELRTFTGHSDDVNDIDFSPNGEQVASVSDDKTVKVWKLNTGRNLRTLVGHTADVNTVAVSPDGEQIATGSDDTTVKTWNIVTGENTATLKGHSGEVWSIAFSPNGQILVSGSADKTIKIWRLLN